MMQAAVAVPDYRASWETARTFDEWLSGVRRYEALWQGIAARAFAGADLITRVEATPGSWRLLVLSEDWCGDAVNLVPAIARLGDGASNLEVRVTGRDVNPGLMDAHRTNGTRSIPVAILLDGDFRPRATWGPRPSPLQDWFLEELRGMPKEQRYPLMRRWYARDRARTTLEEIVQAIEDASRASVRAISDPV